jgi:hypothetical protein
MCRGKGWLGLGERGRGALEVALCASNKEGKGNFFTNKQEEEKK